jgi:hypothetical protein
MKVTDVPTDKVIRLRKRPVEIEAIRFDGTPKGAVDLFNQFDIDGAKFVPLDGTADGLRSGTLTIPTLEGVMTADAGDVVIRGVKGEYYPIKPGILECTYELTEAPHV